MGRRKPVLATIKSTISEQSVSEKSSNNQTTISREEAEIKEALEVGKIVIQVTAVLSRSTTRNQQRIGSQAHKD